MSFADTFKPRRGHLSRALGALSPTLTLLCVALFCTGMAIGGVIYLRRSPVRAVEHAGTAAWWPHLGLLLLSIALLAAARVRRRGGRAAPSRTGPVAGHEAAPVDLLLLAPLGRPAARRIGRTLRTAPRSPSGLARLVVASLLAMLMGYTVVRAGIQVLAGLDPNFTTNAWGGPSYLGAMACHYLDGALIAAACAWLIARLVPPEHA
jgi:hypothetical protein